MNLSDVLSLHDCGGRPAFVQPQAVPHTARLLNAEPTRPDLPEDAVLIDLAAAGEEDAALRRVGAALSSRGVGVLLCATAPRSLSAGRILQALSREQLRLLGLHSTDQPVDGAALVVSRDDALPLRSHVLGQAFTTSTPTSALRRDNEYLLESVLGRARLADADRRCHAAEQETDRLSAELRDAEERARSLEGAVTATEQRLAEATAQSRQLQRALAQAERRNPRELAHRVAGRSRRTAAAARGAIAARLGR